MHTRTSFRYSLIWASTLLMVSLTVGSLTLVARAEEGEAPPTEVPQTQEQTQEQTSETTTTEPGEGTGNGEQGEEATVPGQVEVATSTDGTGGIAGVGGTIVTGDATATSTVQNELNTSISGVVDEAGEANSSVITASTTNVGELESVGESEAATGENVADGGEGLATIVTGTAVAVANVINLVNTNIFNSDGLILFLNEIFGTGLDLRTFNLEYFFDGEAGLSPTVNPETGEGQCTLMTCLNSSELNVLNTNDAVVTNSVIVRAQTGQNVASTTEDGDASIETGDAYAAANVLNLANTNIINSSYLMVAFNNFGDLSGDITLPDADFFSRLLAKGGSAPAMNASSYSVNATNDADFTGETTATAETGENVATTTGTGAGDITTGDAYSMATTYNDVNANYVGGTSVFLLFRTLGTWSGTVRGLPPGMSWAATDDGILVMSDNSFTDLPEAPNANCDDDAVDENGNPIPESNCFNSSHFLASSTNTAVVDNNVAVSATTGENTAVTEDGDAEIATGDAYAAANVVNLINTNIVGRNWIFAIFNIFGDWAGDISFGQSALALTATAEAPSPALPGSNVTYRFTVENSGDQDAENVSLDADFDKALLVFADGSETPSGREWNLGRIGRGESKVFTYTAQVGAVPPGTAATVPLSATVRRGETAGNDVSVLFTVVTVDVTAPAPATGGGGGAGGGGGGGGGGVLSSNSGGAGLKPWAPAPELSLTKSGTATTTATSSMDYTVVLRNKKSAGPSYSSRLTDTLYDPNGVVIYERYWDLGTVQPGEEITLAYTVQFGTSSKKYGTYRNQARLTGFAHYDGLERGTIMTPLDALYDVVLLPNGQVLGAASTTVAQAKTETSNACTPLLTTFVRRGAKNNPIEVKKLQEFLAKDSSLYPAGKVTGFYGPLTVAAVSNFQNKYRAEILTPLGLKGPTGSVLASTQRKINAVACESGASVATAPTTPPPAPTRTAAPRPTAKPKAPAPKPAAIAPVESQQPTVQKSPIQNLLGSLLPW